MSHHLLRHRDDRGATMLEFALVVPLLLLLAFGTAEAGLGWTENNRVEGASSTAARSVPLPAPTTPPTSRF